MNQTGAVGSKVVQLHLTTHCNLACKHCYSMSGPNETLALQPSGVRDYLRMAANQGFECASFSGGEPFIYPHLTEVVSCSAEYGLVSTITTNGMLLNSQCLNSLVGKVSLIAVSLDGPVEIHNAMRGSPAAFSGAMTGMRHLKDMGIPFAIIHTVTEATLPHLRWLAETAASLGAHALQLHPLEQVGRARRELQGQAPNGEVAARTLLLGKLLAREFSQDIKIKIDLFNREVIKGKPELVFAKPLLRTKDMLLSDLVNPVVLEPNGAVLPISFGFNDKYQIANLNEGNLEKQIKKWISHNYSEFQYLSMATRDYVLTSDRYPYFNWYELLTSVSHTYSPLNCHMETERDIPSHLATST